MGRRYGAIDRWGLTIKPWAAADWPFRRMLMGLLLAPLLIDGALIVVGRGGLFGTGLGVAARELVIVAALGGFFLVNNRTLRRIDRERRLATESLREAHEALQVWVNEQARVEEELRDSERRYRFLADAVPQMLWTARADGGADYFNQRWFDYTGQTFEESKEWGWMPVIHPDDLDRCIHLWTQASRSGERYEIEYRFRRGDGEYRWQLGRADPMRDEQGAIVRWFGTCTDIDDQKRVEVELRTIQEGLSDRISERTAELEAANLALVAEVAERKVAEEAAQAASRAKGEFLANMSHEIRTPMNGILGMIELTLGTTLTPIQSEYLGVVASSAEALLTVINDILDFSKIEAGKLELDPVSFPLRDAVTDTLRSLALRAHDKGLELACRIAPDVPRTILGDSGRLRQVLVNLIGNAIKFTETGEVVVTVEVAGCQDAQPEFSERAPVALRFVVSDTGIGIPPAKRAAIFVPFEQADGSTTRRYGGTGLGLSISSKLVHLMGGTIAVADNPGGGSQFHFVAHFAPDPAAAPDAPKLDPLALKGLRILIVDDNATNRRIMGDVLAQWGCTPVAVTGGIEARGALERASARGEPFAIVLLDQQMPGMDGFELAAMIREREATSAGTPLKLVMLTSGGLGGPDHPASLRLDGWLAKPVRQSELLDLLLDLLHQAPPSAAPDPRAPGPSSNPATRRPLEILLAEDHPINQRVATRMIEDLGHRVKVVGDGRLAVDILDSGDFDLVLMDVQMPEMDGFEALAAIRGRELLASEAATHRGMGCPPALPIIALTAHAMTGDRERCLAAGFDDYLSKPVNAARLRAVLDRFTPQATEAASVGPPDEGQPPRFDRQAAINNMGGDERLLDEVIRLFLDDTPRLLDEIHAAAERHDQASLRRLSHTIAGVASNFGPNGVVVAARAVEEVAKAVANEGDAAAAVDRLVAAFDQFQVAWLGEAEVCS